MTNMRLLMDDPIAVGAVLAFLAAGLISWWIIGSDSKKAEERDRAIDDMSLKIDKLLESQSREPATIPPPEQQAPHLLNDHPKP